VPASELVVGVQCGGSDAFSGVTANPAVGFCTDLLVRAGASVMFSETTEVRDGIASSPRAPPRPRWRRPWCARWPGTTPTCSAAASTAAPTPRRQQGRRPVQHRREGDGLDRQERQRADRGVLAPGEKLQGAGLTYAATPASDFICGTLQLAAGMNLHVFTTGRGTPYGLAAVPVIKVATRSDLARRWHDLMDVNAGTIADGRPASRTWAGSCST
jgi:galactarate dehydratase